MMIFLAEKVVQGKKIDRTDGIYTLLTKKHRQSIT